MTRAIHLTSEIQFPVLAARINEQHTHHRLTHFPELFSHVACWSSAAWGQRDPCTVGWPCYLRKMCPKEVSLCHEAWLNLWKSNTWGWQASALLLTLTKERPSPLKENGLTRASSSGHTDFRARLPSLSSIFKKLTPASIKFPVLLPPGLRLVPSLCLFLNESICVGGESHCQTGAAILPWCQLQQQ